MKPRKAPKIIALALAVGVLFWLLPMERPGMALARKTLGAWFSSVPVVTSQELDSWLKNTNRPAPQLLDVRTEAEFKVSHLANARRVDEGIAVNALLATLNTNRPVVVYCAVGYRASVLAQRMQRAGFTNVYNLQGAIFDWASEERPMESEGKPATKVHPYNWAGRKLIEKKYQSE